MVAEDTAVVVRVDLEIDGEGFVGHSLSLSPTGAVVQIDDDVPLGAEAAVRLSLSGLLEQPCELIGRLVAGRLAAGPGVPATWELRWEHRSEAQRDRLDQLLARLRGAEPSRAPLRILLVEDSPMTRQVFELGVMRLLRMRLGTLSLDCAADGEDAWDKLLSQPYDVAIVDCLLPGIQGPELIRKLRGRGLDHVAVVAMSVGGEEMRRSALDAGADLFVHKPVVVAQLLESIERLGRALGARAI